MKVSRAVFGLFVVALGVYEALQLSRFGAFVQSMSILAGIIVGIVCYQSGSVGCSTIFITMICVFLFALFVRVSFCPMVSPPYQPNDEIPYVLVGATIGCAIGLRISRWWNRPKL